MSEVENLANTALGHFNSGRFSEAAEAFERLLAIDPDQGNHWHRLAYSLRQLRRFDEALDAYQQALDHGGDKPEEIHLNRAIICAQHFSNPEEAKAELDAALAIMPDYFSALLNLGMAYEELGDKEAAKAAYEKAQAANPDDTLALTRLAELTDFDDVDHPMLKRMQELLGDSRVSLGNKAGIGFALGRALDSLGHYDEAFAAYRTGNQASRAERGQAAYDPMLETRFTKQIIRTFSTPEPRAAEEERPIFICGMFRSGSTLAERILGRHSRVTTGGELELILAIVETGFARYPDDVATADDRKIEELRRYYLDELEKIRPGADLVTDKQTYNFRHIGLIKQLFPGARIIDTARNPIDNGLAMYFANLGPGVPFAIDLDQIVHWYRDYRRLMAHWREIYPDSIHTLDYDALVADPEPQIRALVDFCGLEWEDACLEPHKAATAVRTASAWQVRQPLYTSSSGRWRNYEKHIGSLIEAFPPA